MRTDLMHEVVLIGVTALAIGCGSGPITGDDEIGDDESESSDGEATDESETEVGDTETDATDTETGDGDGDGDHWCFTSEGTLDPAALRLDSAADRAWVEVSNVEMELPLEGPISDMPYLVGAASDDRIAVARVVGDFGVDQVTTVHSFDRITGELVWTREVPGSGSLVWAADDGWITGSVYAEPGQVAGYAMNDDEAIALTDHQPIAAASGGFVAVHELDMDGNQGAPGWIALADQSWIAAEPSPALVYDVRVAQDDLTLEYVTDGPAFIRATPEGSEVFDLPVAQLPMGNVVLAASAGRFRLLQANDPDDQSSVFVRVDVDSSEAILVDPEPPAGWDYFDCYARNARVTPEGAVLFEMHDDASARVWAFEVDTDQWSEVGFALGLADDMEFVGQFGAVHAVRGAAQFTTFCPQTMWSEPPPNALVGDSLQIVRHTPALALEIDNDGGWLVAVDEHESCVAYANAEGWWVQGLEEQGQLHFGEPTGTWMWLD